MAPEQRAHWRFSWEQRLARNARPVTAPSLTITIHGLSASFAHLYAFGLRTVAQTMSQQLPPVSPSRWCPSLPTGLY
jgi:hypothetical protein